MVLMGAGCGSSNAPFFEVYSVDFGTVDIGSMAARGVDLVNTTRETVQILTITAPEDLEFTVQQPAPFTIGPSATVSLPVAFQPFTAGTKTARVILHTDSADRPTITIDLTGIGGTACLHLSASALDFGNVVVGTSATQTLTLTNCGNVDLDVTPSAIEGGSAAAFSLAGPFPITVKVSDTFDLVVTYAPLSPTPQDAAYFILSLTSLTPSLSNTITLVGGAILSNLALTPNPLHCANSIPAGSSIAFPLHIANQGNATVVVASVAITDPGTPAAFSLDRADWTSGSLQPGEAMDVVVIFAPPSNGNYTGQLDVSSNDTIGVASVQLVCGTTS